jgi:hypothetical protein
VTASDRKAAVAALRALTDLLGSARAARILAEERERWQLETGSLPEMAGLGRGTASSHERVRAT